MKETKRMKIFELEVGGKVVAYSKHKYMLELYLVQRNLETCNFQILRRNIKRETMLTLNYYSIA